MTTDGFVVFCVGFLVGERVMRLAVDLWRLWMLRRIQQHLQRTLQGPL